MKISTKSQYGLRAMSYLAQKKEICSVKEISLEEKIPFNYLSKLFLKLKKAGLVKVKRGAHGGYLLSKSFDKISIGDIIKTLEGSTAPVSCLGLEKKYLCPHKNNCPTKNIWIKIQQSWDKTLSSLTLADALKQ